MNTTTCLKTVLGTAFSLGTQYQLAHWNVTGSRFVSLHNLFGEGYAALYSSSDEIAEYIRSRDTEDFVPGGLMALARFSKVKEMTPSGLTEDAFLKGLIAGEDVLIDLVKECGDQAGKEGDTDTQNFMNEISTAAKKRRWMLVSSK